MGFYIKALVLPFLLLCISASYWSTHGKPKAWILFPMLFVIWLGAGTVATAVRWIGHIWRAATAANPQAPWPR